MERAGAPSSAELAAMPGGSGGAGLYQAIRIRIIVPQAALAEPKGAAT